MSPVEQRLRSLIREIVCEQVRKRKYKGKTYEATAGLDKASWDEKVKAASSWADDPEAAAQAATIVFKGKPAGKD